MDVSDGPVGDERDQQDRGAEDGPAPRAPSAPALLPAELLRAVPPHLDDLVQPFGEEQVALQFLVRRLLFIGVPVGGAGDRVGRDLRFLLVGCLRRGGALLLQGVLGVGFLLWLGERGNLLESGGALLLRGVLGFGTLLRFGGIENLLGSGEGLPFGRLVRLQGLRSLDGV